MIKHSVEEKKQSIQMIKGEYKNSEIDSENKLSIRKDSINVFLLTVDQELTE